MKLALTGGRGVLGSAIARCAVDAGHAVRALSRESRPPKIHGVEWVEGGLDDSDAIAALAAGVDAIVHCAYADLDAPPPTGRSLAENFAQTNLAGTVRLIERAPATSHRQLVFISSLAVYGQTPHRLPRAAELPLDEDFPVWPSDFYGAHKAALEKLVIAGSGDLGLNTSAWRIGCLLAEYPDARRDHLAGVVAEAADGEIVTQMGAYVIADVDAARLLVDALGDDAVRGKVYNCFDGWRDFSRVDALVSELTGRDVRVAPRVRAPRPAPALSNARLAAERAPVWHTDSRIDELVRRLLGGRP